MDKVKCKCGHDFERNYGGEHSTSVTIKDKHECDVLMCEECGNLQWECELGHEDQHVPNPMLEATSIDLHAPFPKCPCGKEFNWSRPMDHRTGTKVMTVHMCAIGACPGCGKMTWMCDLVMGTLKKED